MDTLQIIALALVQGLTEFLPISSSAHLILFSRLLGYADQGLVFDVAAHLGSLLAVLVYFRRDLLAIVTGASVPGLDGLGGHRLLAYLALATLPTLVVGLALADFIADRLRSTAVIVTTTLLFAPLLWWADRRSGRGSRLDLARAVLIGLAQVLALVPGTSRAGVTITAGLFLGLARRAAARFSFLLAIPAVGAAGTFGLVEMLGGRAAINWGEFALAVTVSALAAYGCIAVFLRLIDRIGMAPFVAYRIALGLVLWLLLARGIVS